MLQRAEILHESEQSLLLSFAGQSRWFSREQVRIDEDGCVWIPGHLTDHDPLAVINNVDELVRALTIPGDLAITPKPNRPHQQAAFEKFRQLRCFALHMQMRGGKTKVAIDLLCNHHAAGVIDHVFWCCPLLLSKLPGNSGRNGVPPICPSRSLHWRPSRNAARRGLPRCQQR